MEWNAGGKARFPFSFVIIVLFSIIFLTSIAAFGQAADPSKHNRYQIKLSLDFEHRSYTGTERIQWINNGEHAAGSLFFHLYPNVRPPHYTTPTDTADGPAAPDEPKLEVTGVRAGKTPLFFAVDDSGATLRVNLPRPVASGGVVDVDIDFKGMVPEIDLDETSLVTHVMQQVSSAIRGQRETRRARDINFLCHGAMMLGTAFPLLAARDGDDWFRRVELTIGDTILTDVADYEVSIEAPRDIQIFTSSAPQTTTGLEGGKNLITFTADQARDFAILAARDFRAEERSVGDVNLRTVFRPEHETVARRVLGVAAEALRVYVARFGPLPMKRVTIADAPLVSTLGSVDFSGLSAIASAFYVDFDSPAMRNMPELIREQRASVEDSLEWTVAQVVAHQWWGAAVGNDPARDPILDEALSNWSALLYYREAHGEQRGKEALDEQLRGVYKLYRTFGGEDLEANRAARDYLNSFQYAAIVTCKGALMFEALRQLLGDEKFFAALRSYYQANLFELAGMDDLRGSFVAEAPLEQRHAVARTFSRWLSSKRGDEDIAPPDPKLAADLGIPARVATAKGDKTVFTAFGKVGKFFWSQMTKIR
jgi:hypothetical protein